jgi:hypothetical protein
VAEWLEAWNRATVRTESLGADELEREVLAPLRLLAPLLADGGAYAARVRSLCARVEGRPLPRVAAHGDLTLHNLLLDGATLGVVDWEAARADGLAAHGPGVRRHGRRRRGGRVPGTGPAPGRSASGRAAPSRRSWPGGARGLPTPWGSRRPSRNCAATRAGSTTPPTSTTPAGEASGRPFLGVLRAVAGVR